VRFRGIDADQPDDLLAAVAQQDDGVAVDDANDLRGR
jgi:hypothetical protein